MAGKENESNRLFEDEKVIEIEIERLRSFKDHPFKVTDDKEMYFLKDSIKQYGVLNPLIVRPVPDGVYEIISGHRRKYAAQLLGYRKVPVIIRAISESGVLTPLLIRPDQNDGYEMISGHRRMHAAQKAGLITIPAIVREMTDDEAVIAMVDANIQREELLPSEKAFAYKMKLEAMKRQGSRTDLTLSQNETKLRSDEILSKQVGESRAQVQRFIRLTELIPDLLELVDKKRLNFTIAVDISYIPQDVQKWIYEYICDNGFIKPNQIAALRNYLGQGPVTQSLMISILNSHIPVKAPARKVTLNEKKLTKYFPKNYTSEDVEKVIESLLEKWKQEQEVM